MFMKVLLVSVTNIKSLCVLYCSSAKFSSLVKCGYLYSMSYAVKQIDTGWTFHNFFGC
jgi:hypothetical protein